MCHKIYRPNMIVDRNAATALEFALVGPMFLLFLLAIMDAGGAGLAQADLDANLEDAARLVQTGQARETTYSAHRFGSDFCTDTILLGNCAATVELEVLNFSDFAAASAAVSSWTINGAENGFSPGVSSFDPGDVDDITLIRATYIWRPWLASPLANSAQGNRVMISSALFRNE